MKTVFSIIFLSLLINYTFSQSAFQKFYYVPGGEKYNLQFGYFPEYVHQTKGGDFIIAGSRGTSLESSMVFILKTNESGDTLWTYFYGNEYGLISISQTTDGGYIITTQEISAFDVYTKFLLIKIDSIGTPQWVNSIGVDSVNEGTIGSFTQQIDNGDFITIGTTNSYGAGYADIFVIKTNNNGDTIWTKTYGGVGYDNGRIIKQTFDKGYLLCGGSSSYSTGAMLIKTDTAGNLIWSKTYGGTSSFSPSDVIQTNDGSFIVTGAELLGNGKKIAFILKTDSTGNVSWCKTYNYDDSLSSEYTSIEQTSDNGYIIAGNVDSKQILLKTDINGIAKWTRTFQCGRIGDVEQTKDQGFIIGTSIPKYLENDGYSREYPYLIKTDSLGNSVCNLTTTFNVTVTNEVVSVNTISPQQSSGKMLIEDYNYYTYENAGLTDSMNVFQLYINSSPDTASTGTGTVWVNVSGGTAPFTYQWDDLALQTNDTAFNLLPGTYNVVVTDINGCTESGSVVVNNITSLLKNIHINTIPIYPNPSLGNIYISSNIVCESKIICSLYHLDGKKIYELMEGDYSTGSLGMININLPDIPAGMYILQIGNSSHVYYSKLVLE